MELPYHDLLLHLGCHSSKCSMPQEEKGKKLFRNMDLESNSVVCLASYAAVRMCVTRTRVYSSLGDQAVLESPANSQ